MITISTGNITESKQPSIVNSANDKLILGSGVAGEIRRKGGPNIQLACDRKYRELGGDIKLGSVIITEGGSLGKLVLHAVVKKIGTSRVHAKDVVVTTKNVVSIGLSLGLEGLVLPAFGTGSGKLPLDISALSMKLGIQQALNDYTTNNFKLEIYVPTNTVRQEFEKIFGITEV